MNAGGTHARDGALSITGSANTTTKSTCWSITINNPTEEDLSAWKTIRQHHWVRSAEGQLERGEEGTQHIQGILRTHQVRFSQVKKALPRAHIEVARNPTALARYVTKEATRVSPLTPENTGPGKFQTSITRLIVDHLIHKGLPVVYVTDEYDRSTHRLSFRRTLADWSDLNPKFGPLTGDIQTDRQQVVALIKENEYYLYQEWELFFIKTCKKLIETGTPGVEMVAANPAVRQAYKTYLPSICIRNVHETSIDYRQDSQEESVQEALSTSPSSSD